MDNQPNQSQSQSTPGGSKTGMWVFILVLIVIIAGGAYYFLTQDNDTNTNNANTTVNTVTNTNKNTNALVNENVNENTNTETDTNESANTNTTIDTSDWNTYTDEQSGLSIKYPTDWITVTGDAKTVGFRPADLVVGDQRYSEVYVNLRPNPSHLNLQTFYTQASEFANLYDVSLSNEQVTKDGVTMTYFETIPGAISNSAVALTRGDYVVEVQMHKEQFSSVGNLLQIFFKIASSIQ